MSPAPAKLLVETNARTVRDATVRGLAAFVSGLAERVPSKREIADAAEGAKTAVVEGSGVARDATARIVQREARKLLDDLQVAETLQEVLSGYRLEISASLSLKPLDPGPA